jgi:hypothetical protein
MDEKPSLRYPAKSKCRGWGDAVDLRAGIPKHVQLMRRHSSHLSGDRPVERDSEKTYEFSARKSCIENRSGISDESGRFLIGLGNPRL